MAAQRPSSFRLPDGSPKLSGPRPGTLLSIFPYAFSIQLILCSFLFIGIGIGIIICHYRPGVGHSLLETFSPLVPTWRSLKERGNMQEGRDFRSREQQEPEDKAKGTPVVSKLIKRSQSGRSKVLERFCNLATLWALVHFPAVVAAYEIQRADVMKGYGAIPASVVLVMATVLALRVQDSVQRHWKSFRDSVRRASEMLSYMVWVAVVLLAMVMTLASAINEVDDPKATAFVTDLSCLGIAIIFALALGPNMHGKCRVCGHKPCTCITGGGPPTEQGVASSSVAAV